MGTTNSPMLVKGYLFTEILFESTDIGLRHLISLAYAQQLLPLEKPYFKPSFYLLKCYFCKLLWQSNKKSVIYLQIPLNPSVRRVRRVYTLILNFTYNHATHFSKKTINPTCQCFLLVTFLSRKKSDKTRPLRIPRVPRVLRVIFVRFFFYGVFGLQDSRGNRDRLPPRRQRI